MNYKEARVYLESISKYGSVLGLENMRELLRRLSSPQNRLRFIHIAGTNGKGSVLAYLSKILSSAGYRTGKYVSPTLLSYEERIQVDDAWISQEEVADLVSRIRPAIEAMKAEKGMHATIFEVETAMALMHFVDKDCDIVVLETGLGGRQDATNIIPSPEVAVLTSISEDHLGIIGDNIEEIAREKAGIIKSGSTVVTGSQRPEVMDVLKEVAREKGCNFITACRNQLTLIATGLAGLDFRYGTWGTGQPLHTSMLGLYQLDNAIIAIEAIGAMRARGFEVSDWALREGLSKASMLGRFSRISQKPDIILDGAHNPAGAKALRETIQALCPGRTAHCVFGVFADKDYQGIIRETSCIAEKVWTVPLPDKARALSPEETAAAWNRIWGQMAKGCQNSGSLAQDDKDQKQESAAGNSDNLDNSKNSDNREIAVAAASVEDAVAAARRAAGAEGLVVCYGSLSYLGQAYRAVQAIEEKESKNG